MKSLDSTARKNFPWIIVLATVLAVLLVMVFQDPLQYLRDIFVSENFLISSLVYTVVLALSVLVSRFSIAPAVPFVAKILSPEVTFILTIVGWTIGSCGAFLLARFGKELAISHVYPLENVIHNEYRLHKEPQFITLLQTRLFAALDNMSYFLGLKTVVKFSRFFIITLLGSIPAAFIFSYSADAIADGDRFTLFGLFFATSLIVLSYISHKGWSLFERPIHVYTRKDSFKAGEMFGVAALIIFFENRNRKYKIHRVPDPVSMFEKKKHKKNELYVCDMSASFDDSHNIFGSVDAGVRGNNIPYHVFGLVWRKYGSAICDSEIVSKHIDQELVWGIDAEDAEITHEEASGIYINQWSLSEILEKNYISEGQTFVTKDGNHQAFMKAVLFAKNFLNQAIENKRKIDKEYIKK